MKQDEPVQISICSSGPYCLSLEMHYSHFCLLRMLKSLSVDEVCYGYHP